jgi:hypothetical protein
MIKNSSYNLKYVSNSKLVKRIFDKKFNQRRLLSLFMTQFRMKEVRIDPPPPEVNLDSFLSLEDTEECKFYASKDDWRLNFPSHLIIANLPYYR